MGKECMLGVESTTFPAQSYKDPCSSTEAAESGSSRFRIARARERESGGGQTEPPVSHECLPTHPPSMHRERENVSAAR